MTHHCYNHLKGFEALGPLGDHSRVVHKKDIDPPCPSSKELVKSIRQDAIDFLEDALAQATRGSWSEAYNSADIARDRLDFAQLVADELDELEKSK